MTERHQIAFKMTQTALTIRVTTLIASQVAHIEAKISITALHSSVNILIAITEQNHGITLTNSIMRQPATSIWTHIIIDHLMGTRSLSRMMSTIIMATLR